MLALTSEFCSSCVSLTQLDTHTHKKLLKSQKKAKQSRHHAENLDRQLQVVFDFFRVITIAFSRFKIQFLFKPEKENHQNNIGDKYLYLKSCSGDGVLNRVL